MLMSCIDEVVSTKPQNYSTRDIATGFVLNLSAVYRRISKSISANGLPPEIRALKCRVLSRGITQTGPGLHQSAQLVWYEYV